MSSVSPPDDVQSSRSRTSPSIPVYRIALAAIVLLAINAWLYHPFFADDALISLRYTERLLAGKGLTWTDGHPVEGYSNLLWVLLCALPSYLGIDLITGARILGFIGTSAAILAVVRAYGRNSGGDPTPAIAGSMALALSGTMAIWSIGGLEQPLIAGLLAWALTLCYPLVDGDDVGAGRILGAGTLFGLIAITRPDGALLAGAAGIGILLARGFDRAAWRAVVLLAVAPVLFVAGQLAFRLSYYGEWVPNTALIKIGFGGARLLHGASYVGQAILWLLPLLILLYAGARGALTRSTSTGRRLLFLLVPAVLWCGYMVTVGDIFPGWRQMIQLVVVVALMLAESLRGRTTSGAGRRRIAMRCTVALLFFGIAQYVAPHDLRARNERWEWDGESIGLLFKRAFSGQAPLVAVDAAGCIPYWSELPSLDMLGLNDYHIARHRNQGVGGGWLGHEFGDGAYVESRKPDILVFGGPGGHYRATLPSGIEMQQSPSFFHEYTLVRFLGTDPHPFQSVAWVRRYGGAIGVRRNKDVLTIPGFLLNGDFRSVAHLDAGGALVTTATREIPASINDLRVEGTPFSITVNTAEGRFIVTMAMTSPDRFTIDRPFTMTGTDGRIRVTAGCRPAPEATPDDLTRRLRVDLRIEPVRQRDPLQIRSVEMFCTRGE